MKNLFKIFSLLIFITLVACTKEDDLMMMDTGTNTGADTDTTNIINYIHDATSNHLIVSETIGSTSDQNSTIYHTISNGANGMFFIGVKSGNRVIGSMHQNGIVDWTKTVGFIVRDINTYEEDGNHYLVAVGARDSNGDDSWDEGVIATFDSEGDKLDEKAIKYDSFNVWLNAIELPTEGSGFLFARAGGGANQNGNLYPYLVSFSIDRSSGTINIYHENESSYQLYESYPNRIIRDVIGISNSLLSYNIYNNNESTGYGLMKTEGFEIVWDVILSNDIVAKGYINLNAGIALDGDNVYLTATMKTEKLELEESTSTNWYIGRLYSISALTGSINWESSLNYSNVSDKSKGLFVKDNSVYVYGEMASWVEGIEEPKLNLGYGFISKFNKTNGIEQAFHSFGKNTYKQAFNTAIEVNNQIYLSGFTRSYHSTSYGGTFDRWMIKVNTGNL